MQDDDPKILTIDSVRYVPTLLAAWTAQISDTTLQHWIKKGLQFNKQAIKTHTSELTGELYISEASLLTIQNRFLKWPSKESAGRVSIGETRDHDGYLGLVDSARIIGVNRKTLWDWANRGEVPSIGKMLDVIKCPVSDQLYVREHDVFELSRTKRKPGPVRHLLAAHATTAR